MNIFARVILAVSLFATSLIPQAQQTFYSSQNDSSVEVALQQQKDLEQEVTATPTPENIGAYPPPVEVTPTPTVDPSTATTTPIPTNLPTITPTPEITPIPVETEIDTTKISLKTSANPAIFIPGKQLRLSWQIHGRKYIPEGSIIQILISIPEGMVPSDTSLLEKMSGDRTILLAASDSQGEITCQINSDVAAFPLYVKADLLVNNVVFDSQIVQIEMAGNEVEKNQGGTVNGFNGNVHVVIPPDALEETSYFSIRNPGPNKVPPVSLTGNPIEIISVGKNSGENLNKFNKPIQIQFQYDPQKILSGSEEDLLVYYYDEETLDWYPLVTSVDKENHRLNAYSDHLTVFDYKAATWQANSLPSVDSFKVSDFTGAATYSYSFWTPAGPNGFSPNLSLSYNSQIIDESSAYTQASWVGMGWSLDTGAITRNMHDSNNVQDDTFSISVNGISGLLLPISDSADATTYNLADQSFVKVQYLKSTNVWKVWGKDGTRYEFNYVLKTNQTSGCVTNSSNLSLSWKWSLTSIIDKNNNIITYNYSKETKPGCLNEIANYPLTIVYPSGKYRILFTTEPRTDYQSSWEATESRVFFSKIRLKEIYIQHDPNGAFTTGDIKTLRKYSFGYAQDAATTNVIMPQFHFSGGGHVLTLTDIQESGFNAGVSLPKTTFEYGDENSDGTNENLHLIKVNNGYGGGVQIQYERWSYFDDENDTLRSLLTEFGTNNGECGPNYGTAWTAVEGAPYVQCTGQMLGSQLQVGVDSIPPVYSVGRRSIPENVIKPGSQYRFYIYAQAQSNTADVNWGFRDTSTQIAHFAIGDNISTTLSGHELTLEMPVTFNPATTMLEIQAEGVNISKLQFMVFPTYYRVKTKTITDETTDQSYTYTYQYDNASPNTALVSKAVETNSSENLYSYKMREFRGHAVAQTIDPAGVSSIAWYHQDDILKGKPYHTMVIKQNLKDSFESQIDSGSTFNNEWTWTANAGSSESIYGQDFDYSFKLTSSQENWNTQIVHNNASLNDGEVAVGQFRLHGDNAQGEIGLVSETGKIFGIRIQPNNGQQEVRLHYDTGSGLQTGSLLISNNQFELDRWYVVAFFLDNDDGFRVRLWQLDNPEISGEASQSGFGADNWRYRQRVYNGSLSIDEYFEGVLYSESETNYSSVTQYDTIADNGIPDLVTNTQTNLSSYKDLAIIWSYQIDSLSRTYASDAALNIGDAKWMGTRSTYQYLTEDQNSTQYGNLTRTIYSEWDGTNWIDDHASKTEYWPRNDANSYLVSFPARTLSLDCHSGCDFTGVNGLLGEELFLYGSNTVYQSTPDINGRVAKHKSLVDVVSNEKRYGEIAFTYDTYGNVLSKTTYTGYATSSSSPSDGQLTLFAYDGTYHTYQVSETNAAGKTTYTSYDYNQGVPLSIIDANNAVTNASYDSFGRIISVTRPGDFQSPTLLIEYHDEKPFWTSATQKINGLQSTTVRKIYDGLGRLIQTQQANENLESGNKDVIVDYQYDFRGHVTYQSVPEEIDIYPGSGSVYRPYNNPFTTNTDYDLLGRPIRSTSPDSFTVEIGYGMSSVQTVKKAANGQYQVISNLLAYTSKTEKPSGSGSSEQVTTTSYQNSWGQMSFVRSPLPPYAYYMYDSDGNLSDTLIWNGTSKFIDPQDQLEYAQGGIATSISFDLAGRKTSMSDADMGSWNYEYDAVGNLVRQTDAKNQATCLYYDSLNRLIGKFYIENAASTSCPSNLSNYSVSLTYDQTSSTNSGIGRLTQMEDNSGTTKWTYDLLGRVTHEEKHVFDKTSQFDLGIYDTYWSYNSDDSVRQMVYPNQETVNYSYTNQGTIDRVYSIQDSTYVLKNYVQATSYTAAGQVSSRALGNGIIENYSYNNWDTQNGRLQNITAATPGPGSITYQNISFAYDAVGNILSIADNMTPDETLSFTYDSLNRLDSVSIVSEEYSEDPVYDPNTGNLVSRTGDPYSYDDPSHPHAVTGVGSNTYSYDANGNMTSRTSGGAQYTLGYDIENRVTTISGGTTNARYVYDGNGARVLSVVNGVRTIYIGNYFEAEMGTGTQYPVSLTSLKNKPFLLFLGFVVCSDTSACKTGSNPKNVGNTVYRTVPVNTGNVNITWRTYYYAGGARIAMRTQGNLSTYDLNYFLTDQVNSTSKTVKQDGSVLSTIRYTAWGETRSSTGTVPTDRKYTGQIEDEAGLYFYNARWYDPLLGRFAQADTVIPEPGNPLAWDRYAYVNNNPIKLNDPTGHCPLCFAAIIGGAIGAVIGAVGYTAYTVATGQEFNTGTMLLAAGGGAVAGGLIGTGVGLANGLSVASATTTAVTTATMAETANAACGGDMCAGEVKDSIEIVNQASPVIDNFVSKTSDTLVSLYRTVTNGELKDIIQTQGFRPEPNGASMDAKWFWETLQGAKGWTKLYPSSSNIIEVQVPNWILDYAGLRSQNVDGLGPALAFIDDGLEQLNQAIQLITQILQ